MPSDERTCGLYPHAVEAQAGLEMSFRATGMPRDLCHTDGAVFAVPAGAAFTLAIPAGPMFCAARVAGPLVACGPHPAVLTAAGASYADAVATAVSSTDLCGRERGAKGQGWGKRERRGGGRENKSLLSQLLLGTGVTPGHLVRLCELSGGDSRGSAE